MKLKCVVSAIIILLMLSSLFILPAVVGTSNFLDKNTDVFITSGFLHFTITIKNNCSDTINATWNISVKRIGLDKEFNCIGKGGILLPAYLTFKNHYFGFGILSVIVVTVDIVETDEHYTFKGYQILGLVIFF